jgi:hypothetical protein
MKKSSNSYFLIGKYENIMCEFKYFIVKVKNI